MLTPKHDIVLGPRPEYFCWEACIQLDRLLSIPARVGRVWCGDMVLRYVRFVRSKQVAEMWRKVLLTGVMSVISPGSMLQIMIASLTSLMFLVAHSRAWPFADDSRNRMKLGPSAVAAPYYY